MLVVENRLVCGCLRRAELRYENCVLLVVELAPPAGKITAPLRRDSLNLLPSLHICAASTLPVLPAV